MMNKMTNELMEVEKQYGRNKCHESFHTAVCITGVQAASVARLDACPTGDQEVAGSTPTGSAKFFCGDLTMTYFLRSYSPFC